MPATATKPRPIILHAWEVRAILAGQKTQLRRVIEPQPDAVSPNGCPLREIVPSLLSHRGDLFDVRYEIDNPRAIRCPFGIPGDRLYVKEDAKLDGSSGFGGVTTRINLEYRVRDQHGSLVRGFARGKPAVYGSGWWVDAHRMPKWASRFDLENSEVRVERLGSISEADAIAEGLIPAVGPNRTPMWEYSEKDGGQFADPRVAFRMLWESMCGAGSWDPALWVWVVGVKRLEGRP